MFDCSKIKQLGIDRQENLRPIILNGIEEIATRSDLLDRCIVLELPVIAKEKRRPEADFWREFEQVRPGILGALLIIALPAGASEKVPRDADHMRIYEMALRHFLAVRHAPLNATIHVGMALPRRPS